MRLIESNRHTEIKVSIKQLPIYKNLISSYIVKFGGREVKRSTRFIYIEIDADLLNANRQYSRQEVKG
jgi:hypothetical protein